MLWACLLPSSHAPSTSHDDRLQGLAVWALRYTPKVAFLRSSVVLELEASARLFGGRRTLRLTIESGATELDTAIAWAPNALASLALVRFGVAEAITQPLSQILDALPLTALDAVAKHATTLGQIGCCTLADVCALPRGGISRRFGAATLGDLDTAYGLRPEAQVWIELPQTSRNRLELMARVETAPALLFGARRLLLQLGGWPQHHGRLEPCSYPVTRGDKSVRRTLRGTLSALCIGRPLMERRRIHHVDRAPRAAWNRPQSDQGSLQPKRPVPGILTGRRA